MAPMTKFDFSLLYFGRESPRSRALRKPPSFLKFPLLPTELRLRIWRFCFPPGRKAALALSSIHRDICYPRPEMPVTLRVNVESRAETLRHYSLAFTEVICSSIKEFDTHPPREAVEWIRRHKPKLCFDVERDTLFFSSDYFYHHHLFQKCLEEISQHVPRNRTLKNVKRLQIEDFCWQALDQVDQARRHPWYFRHEKILLPFREIISPIFSGLEELEIFFDPNWEVENCIKLAFMGSVERVMSSSKFHDWYCEYITKEPRPTREKAIGKDNQLTKEGKDFAKKNVEYLEKRL